MSKQSDVNNTAITGAEAIFILKTVLKAAGWTVPRSSDGITYNSSGDQISHGGSGANGMENDRAWFVIQSPNGEHQWCFQKEVTDNAEWRVKVSALDGFTGGSPNATTVPSAVDEYIIHGSGSDAAPVMADLFPTDGNFRWSVIAEDAPVGTAVPIYGFWGVCTSVAGAMRTFICQEPMDPDTFPELSAGTRAAPVTGDPDPCIYSCTFNGSGYSYDIEDGWQAFTYIYGWHRMNYVDEVFQGFDAAHMYGDSNAYQGAPHTGTYGFGQNPYNGADEGIPILIGRDATVSNPGLKGFTKFLRIKTTDRQYPNTINLATDAKVYAGDLLVPWENGTAPLI